ncbi:MAG TPA: alanine racemase [Longimicrobiaceae bacterium]|nr:alanine racemase [Longimicrobiaceae bacterium]
MTSRAWVEVDLGALERNLLRVSEAAPGAGVVPMLKANAYGLGTAAVLRAVTRALAPGGPWAIGVAAVAEGEALRGLGWAGRVLVFPPVAGEEERAARAGLTLAVSDLDALERWAAAARRAGKRLAFHAEVDTGMGRAGFPPGSAAEWGARAAELSGDLLAWEGCFTHFHSADEPDLAPTDEQVRLFRAALERLPPEPEGGPRRVVHCANSAAALRRGGYGMDLVRPGIFLYGGDAGPGVHPEPVASLRARVVLARRVPPGTSAGYGATYVARREEGWATLAAGYGDGLPRALGPGGGEALLHGRRVPVVGRISMDVTVVDATGVPGVRSGDVATFLGRDGAEEIRLDEAAARAGTISYEVLTGLTARLPRLYQGGPNT